MNRLTLAVAAVILALAGNAAFADDGGGDNSMTRLTGDSYAYFEAAMKDQTSRVDVKVAKAKKDAPTNRPTIRSFPDDKAG